MGISPADGMPQFSLRPIMLHKISIYEDGMSKIFPHICTYYNFFYCVSSSVHCAESHEEDNKQHVK